MIELFSDILFDIEYKCKVDKEYNRLYLYSNGVCVDSYNRISEISNYLKVTHSNLLEYHEFDLEKAEYVWSIKKFLNRNVPKDFNTTRMIVKVISDISFKYFCLYGNYNKIGDFTFSGNSSKLYMLEEQRRELSRKFKTAHNGMSWNYFDEVLLWNIEYKLNKLWNKLKEQNVEFSSYTFDGLEIKKEVV